MSFLTDLLAPTPVAPATVDEAIAGLTVALDNLANVSIDKRQSSADLHAQADAIKALAVQHEAEADRADRIHDNISSLLK